MKKLTKVQAGVLRGLKKYGGWQKGCGWRWSTSETETELACDALVKKGYAIRKGFLYTATDKEVTE